MIKIGQLRWILIIYIQEDYLFTKGYLEFAISYLFYNLSRYIKLIEKSSIIDVESNEKKKRKICTKRLRHTIICIHEKILDICIGAIFIFYLDKKKKNRIEGLNDKKKKRKS